MIAAADCAVRRWVIDGAVYTPVVTAAGRALGPAEVAALAVAPAPATPVRRLQLMLGDEAMPRSGPPALDLRRVRLPGPGLPPLEFALADLVVGRLEALWIAPAGAVADTVGRVMGATARMGTTQLADIVYAGVRAGVLTGVSIRAYQLPDATVLEAVRLGDRGESCLAAAHVVRAWETPA